MSGAHDEASLTRRVTVGAIWLVAGRWSMRLIGLVSTVLLARLLTPEDFGIVVLSGLVVAVLDALTDFRFGQALVHYQDAKDEEYNTAWTLNILRGFLVATILFGGSWIFSSIFKEPRLIEVFWALALIAVIDSFQNIGTIHFTREIRFDREFFLRLGQKLSSFVVCVALALYWKSYWALIAGMIAGSSARLILSYTMHPYRPRFCISAWKRLFSFSIWLMASQIITLINQRLEQFLIGGFMTPTLVGIYNLAYELSAMATGELVGPAAQALFPGFSKIAEDKTRLRQAYEKSVQIVVSIGTPLGVCLALVAPEFILTVLGSKWIEAEFPLRVLSVMFSISALAMASTSVLPALGRTRDVFFIDFTLFFLRVPITILIIMQFGFAGAVWARLGAGVWWVGHYMWIVRRALGVSFSRILRVTWRSYAATAVMVLAVLLLGTQLPAVGAGRNLNLPIQELLFLLVAKTTLGLLAYLCAHMAFWALSGKPDGPERTIIGALRQRMRPAA